MNPFLLTQMNNGFVPDRQSDIAETTPMVKIKNATVSGECSPTGGSGHVHSRAGGTAIGGEISPPRRIVMSPLTIHRFDVMHKSDHRMLKDDGENVQVICNHVVDDDCRGDDMIKAIFDLEEWDFTTIDLQHNEMSMPTILRTIDWLSPNSGLSLIFIIITNIDCHREAMLTEAVKHLDWLGSKRYNLNDRIYFNPIKLANAQDLREYRRIVLQPSIQLNHEPLLDSSVPMQVTKLEDTEYFQHTRTKPRDEGNLVIIDYPPLPPFHGNDLIKAIQMAGVRVTVDSDSERDLFNAWTAKPAPLQHYGPLPETFHTNDIPAMNINLTNVSDGLGVIAHHLAQMAKTHTTFMLALYSEHIDRVSALYNVLTIEDGQIIFQHITRPSPNLIQLFISKPSN